MKKSFVFIVIMMFALAGFTQKGSTAVVMYFKADLACCKARACAALESDVKSVVETNFPAGNVVFKEVRLSDPENAELVKKYNAQSQTVIIVVQKKKKLHSVDATELVKQYSLTKDKASFETAFVKMIKDNM